MAEITLVAEPGRATGTPSSKRLRAAGRIPAVIYGGGSEATSVSVDARELRVALSGEAGTNALLDLDVAGTRHLTLARVIQRHPVRNTVVHVDFQIVRRDEAISVEVPVVLSGEARSVELEQGMVEQQLTTLTVEALPGDIPNELTVDITELQIGDTIRVGDIALPRGVTTAIDAEEAVAIASASALAAAEAELEAIEVAMAEEASEGAEPEAGDAEAADGAEAGDGADTTPEG